MRKFTKAAAMLCAAAMVIPSASVFAAEDGGASELTEVGTYPISEEPLEFTMFRTNMPNVEDFQTNAPGSFKSVNKLIAAKSFHKTRSASRPIFL